MMDPGERKRSRLDQVLGFCADTTAHGLGRVAAAKSWIARLFWISIFIVAFVYSMLEIYQSIAAYLSYPTKTDISIVNKEHLRFPAVTVCNINPFKQSEIKKSPLWKNLVNLTTDENLDLNRKAIKDNLFKKVSENYKDDSWKLGHPGEELITHCTFPGNQQHLHCSYKNFSHFFDTVYGNCFTFNGSDTSVTQPGHRQGLKLVLLIDTDEYIGILAESVGAIVTVHSPFVKPDLDESSLFVAPGSAVYVSLQTQNVSLLDYPYNGETCNSSISYSQKNCLSNCVAKEMRKKCGCVSVVTRQQPLCDSFNQTQADCLDSISYNQDSLDCSCDPPCSRLYFAHTVSSSTWPSKKHMGQLIRVLKKGKNRTAQIVKDLTSARDNMVRVNIHFASMTLKDMSQSPAITRESLLGTIGGQLGLFIGVSLITLVEFLNLLWRLILPRQKTTSNQTRDFEEIDTEKDTEMTRR
ncbi:bile acid-sensitive ion channel-like [Oculina patagonica]